MKALIVVITLIGLCAVAAAIIVGMKTFEGIVVEKPYETGLAWDSIEKERASLGWKVDLRTEEFRKGGNTILLSISDKEGKALPDADVSIKVSRASTNAYDKLYPAACRAGGICEAQVLLPLFGYWDIDVRVRSKGKSFVFPKRIFARNE